MQYLGKYNICELDITACDYEWIIDRILNKRKRKVIYAPIASHPITLANVDKNYYKVLKQVDYLLPDGQYVRWSLEFLYGISLQDRVYGPELFIRLLNKIEKQKLKIYLIGNNLPSLINILKIKYSQIRRVFYYDLHFKDVSREIINKVNNELKEEKPDIIFIGIGTPSQHFFATKLDVHIPIICVGAAFNFISHSRAQAPIFIQNIGLEWLFRLIKEPGRLFSRYLFFGTTFILMVLTSKLKKMFSRQ